MTIFYFMMGIYVHLNVDFFRENFAFSIIVTALNVLVTPLIVWLMGYICGLKCRTTVYTRCLCVCVRVCVCVCVQVPRHNLHKVLALRPKLGELAPTTESRRARERECVCVPQQRSLANCH
jgi:hypothetical protein